MVVFDKRLATPRLVTLPVNNVDVQTTNDSLAEPRDGGRHTTLIKVSGKRKK